jgi:hypothetical protein
MGPARSESKRNSLYFSTLPGLLFSKKMDKGLK